MNRTRRKKCSRSISLGGLKILRKTDQIENNRPSSLPEPLSTYVIEIDEEEIQGLTAMLQDAIANNPTLESFLNELELD